MQSVRQAKALENARVVFTGKLASMTRQEAHLVVKQARGEPGTMVSRQTTILVVGMEGWPLLPDGAVSNKLRRAEEINQRYHSIQIISELVFLELAGLTERKGQLKKIYSSVEVCRLLKLDAETLRHWEHFSLIRSEEGNFDFQDMVTLRMIAALLQQGVRLETIATSIRGLASILPGTDRPLAQLKILAESPRTLLAIFGDNRITPEGQLVLNFDTRYREEPGVIEFRSSQLTAAGWLQRGQILEEDEDLDGAEKAYLKALALQPHFAEAYFSLGNVLRERDRLGVAEQAYRTCVAQDPAFSAGWYNLAEVLEAKGDSQGAIQSLTRAVEIAPSFADAHFNLAACLERIGHKKEADRHWAAYLKLDPDSQWAEAARRQLALDR